MALRLYEEHDRFRVYDEETEHSSPEAKKIEDLLRMIDKHRDLKIYINLDAFSMRKIILPDFERDKMKEVLPFEMEGLFLSPSSAYIFDFYPVKPAEEGTECLVFALKKETAEKYITPFVRAGLNIVSLSPVWDDRLTEAVGNKEAFYRKALNLAPAGLTGEKNKRKVRDIYRVAFLYAVTLLLIFIFGLSFRYYLMLQKEARMKQEISTVYSSLFPGQKIPADLYYGVQSKLIELKQNYRVFKGIEVIGILKLVSESSREGIRVKEITMEGNKVILKGEVPDYSVLELFKNNLKKSFREVQLLETKNMPDAKSGFAVEVTVND